MPNPTKRKSPKIFQIVYYLHDPKGKLIKVEFVRRYKGVKKYLGWQVTLHHNGKRAHTFGTKVKRPSMEMSIRFAEISGFL